MSDHQPHGSAVPAAQPGDPHDPQAVPHDAAHFHNHAMLYLGIGIVLLLGTALTVALSYVDFGTMKANIVVALLLAAVKGTLVALIFMHLKQEKKSIYQFLFVTAIFVTGLFLLSVLAFVDHIRL